MEASHFILAKKRKRTDIFQDHAVGCTGRTRSVCIERETTPPGLIVESDASRRDPVIRSDSNLPIRVSMKILLGIGLIRAENDNVCVKRSKDGTNFLEQTNNSWTHFV